MHESRNPAPRLRRNQRISLVVAALLIAVVAFVVAQPGNDGEDRQWAAERAPAQKEATTTGEETQRKGETGRQPPRPKISRIRIRRGAVVGGPQRVQAAAGDTVRILVNADAPDEIHLHGYDVTRNAGPGRPARFVFRADVEGIFALESHVAEDAGRDPIVARLVVEPS
jgi:FtsP/CotA-like multicopper oxidase with cupredoxin domain